MGERLLFRLSKRIGGEVIACNLCRFSTFKRMSAVHHAKMHARYGEARIADGRACEPVEVRYCIVEPDSTPPTETP